MRRKAIILERAEKGSEGFFLALIPRMKEGLRLKLLGMDRELRSMQGRVTSFKEESVPTALSNQKKALEELNSLVMQPESKSDQVFAALDKIENCNKERECLFLKSYILQQELVRAWKSLNYPSLATYCEEKGISDPYFPYNVGAYIAPTVETSVERLF